MAFAGPVARNYADTRYIPDWACRTLIIAAVKAASLHHPIRRIADVGCGSGRLLRGFVNVRKDNCLAFDSSVDMLRQIPPGLLRSGINAIQKDCSKPNALGQEQFELVLCHWVANVTPRWPEIFRNCLRALQPGGSLLWFEERGDLYELIDGNAETLLHCASPLGFEIFGHFQTELGIYGSKASLESRDGLGLNEVVAERLLGGCSSEIQRLAGTQQTWQRTVNLAWLVRTVIRDKAFSNAWSIPSPVYERALCRTMSHAARYGQDLFEPLTLRYSSVPVLATLLR